MLRLLLLLSVYCSLISFTYCEEQPHRTGRFQTVFTEHNPLSSSVKLVGRMGYKLRPQSPLGFYYDIKDESFEVYVPQAYNAQTPYGLAVWVSPGDSGGIHDRWRTLMDKHKLIWVGANKSGNKEYVDARRIPLALDAAYNVQKLYIIDPDRVFAWGLSGGGRVSSMAAVHYPDVFPGGGIFIIGANYWRSVLIPGQQGKYWKASMPKPQDKCLTMASKNGRFVFLTGDNDSNQLEMKTYYEKGYRKYLKNVIYLQVPGMGHEPPPLEWVDRALDYLDDKTKEQKSDQIDYDYYIEQAGKRPVNPQTNDRN